MDSLLRLFCLFLLIINGSKKIIASSFNDSFYHCKSLYRDLSIKGMGIHPGYGWDNLQNLEKGNVAAMNYFLCRVTDDELYFIPDDVQIIPLQKTNIEQNAEVFSDWTQYTSMSSKSINLKADSMSNPYLSISASFSYDHQYVKSHQVKDDSTTTRVSLTYLHYNILLNPVFQLDSKFKNRLLDIAFQLQDNKNQMADYLAELLIRDYGTHVVTSVDAGAILLKEDHIKKRFVENNQLTSNSISAAAGVSFKQAFGLQVKFSSKNEQDFVDQYSSNLSATHIETIGGPYFHINSNVSDWEKNLNDFLATIDRQGNPLPTAFSAQTLPELSQTMIIKLVKVTEDAIQRYYKFNVHAGCTKKKSPNFFFQANIDDGTCEAPYTNFTFGGLYQTCVRRNSYGDDSLCEKFRQVNPLTGSYSCASGYQNVLMQNSVINHDPISKCNHDYCYRWLVFWTKCDEVCNNVQPISYIETYWCYETKNVQQNSGYLFGGLYTQNVRNPLTQEKSCPPYFIKLNVLRNMIICVSDDFELGFANSLPFGGFFSCKNGNPLNDHNTPSGGWLRGCPVGHSQHLAEVDDGCEIEFCVKMNSLSQDYSFPPIVQPPFSKPETDVNTKALKLLLTSDHKVLQKFPSDKAWKLTEFNKLSSTDKKQTVTINSQMIALVVGLTSIVFLALIIGVIYFKKYRKRRENYSPLSSPVNSDEETLSETTPIISSN